MTSGAALPEQPPRGPGRVLVFVYGLFAVAALGRSSYQLVTKASEAPVAYTLSALAAAVYVAGAALLLATERNPRWARAAAVLCVVEIVGVLGVGTLSMIDEDAFPDESVWSAYGAGYGYIPAVLPLLALWWLRRQESHSVRRSA